MVVTRSQAKALENQMAVAAAEAAEVEAVEVEVEPGVGNLYCDESPISSPQHVYEPIELFPIASIEHGKEQISIIKQPFPVVIKEASKDADLILLGVCGAVGIGVVLKYSDQLFKSVKHLLKTWFEVG